MQKKVKSNESKKPRNHREHIKASKNVNFIHVTVPFWHETSRSVECMMHWKTVEERVKDTEDCSIKKQIELAKENRKYTIVFLEHTGSTTDMKGLITSLILTRFNPSF